MIRTAGTALLLTATLFAFAPSAARADDLVTVTAMDEEFTPEQQAKLREAVAIANRVLASAAFRERLAAVRQFTYSGDDGAAVHRTLTGKAYSIRFEAVAKYAVNFFGIRRVSSMVASSGHGSGHITFNTLRMREFPASYYAGTIIHELSHIAGYSHRGNHPTSKNLRSVPYVVGELVAELAEAEPTPARTPGLSGTVEREARD